MKPLTSKQLGRLAARMVVAKTPEAARKLREKYIAGFYGVPARPADVSRRIAAMMRTAPWIESRRDYNRVSRLVLRAAVCDEKLFSEREADRLELLAAQVAAFEAGEASAAEPMFRTREQLKRRGFKIGSADEFLGLTKAESRIVDQRIRHTETRRLRT